MNQTLNIELLDYQKDRPQVQALKDEWERLLSMSTRPSIYSTFDYLCLSIDYFTKDAEEIFFIIMRQPQSNTPVAIFPMSLWIRKLGKHKIHVLEHAITTGNSDVDKPYPLINREYETECWSNFHYFLNSEYKKWDWIEYYELIPESQLYHNLKQHFPFPKYLARQNAGPVSPIISLDGTWEAFWRKHRNTRKKIRRLKRKLGDSYAFKVFDQPSVMERSLREYIETEKNSWKKDKGLSEKTNQVFYASLLEKLSHLGRAHFSVLYDGKIPMATELSYTYMDTVYFAHSTYNTAYRHLSPGSIATSLSIEYFHNKGFKHGDFLAGFASYIDPFAEEILPTKETVIFKVNKIFIYYAMVRLWAKIKFKLKKLLKKALRMEQS